MSTILYHFTGAPFIEKIKLEGLCQGALPWNLNRQGRPTFIKPFQWLTSNPEWVQPWCLLGSLPFARNAYRITVMVPERQLQRLLKWSELCRRCLPDSAEEINAVGSDSGNWWVFNGRIPPSWFLTVEANYGERVGPRDN